MRIFEKKKDKKAKKGKRKILTKQGGDCRRSRSIKKTTRVCGQRNASLNLYSQTLHNI